MIVQTTCKYTYCINFVNDLSKGNKIMTCPLKLEMVLHSQFLNCNQQVIEAEYARLLITT